MAMAHTGRQRIKTPADQHSSSSGAPAAGRRGPAAPRQPPAEGPRPEKLPVGAPGLPHREGDLIPETCAPLISLSNLVNSSILKKNANKNITLPYLNQCGKRHN